MFSFVHSFLFCVVKNIAEARRVQIWLKGVNLFALKAVERLLCPVMTSNLIVSWKCSIRILPDRQQRPESENQHLILYWFFGDFYTVQNWKLFFTFFWKAQKTYGSGILGATLRCDGGTYFDFCGWKIIFELVDV